LLPYDDVAVDGIKVDRFSFCQRNCSGIACQLLWQKFFKEKVVQLTCDDGLLGLVMLAPMQAADQAMGG